MPGAGRRAVPDASPEPPEVDPCPWNSEAFAAIGADQFPATVEFYRTLFAREPDRRVHDIYEAFRLPGLHLGIIEPRAKNRPDFASLSDIHSSLNLVLQVPNVERARTELEALSPSRPPGSIQPTSHGRAFYASDIEGNRLIVVERTSKT